MKKQNSVLLFSVIACVVALMFGLVVTLAFSFLDGVFLLGTILGFVWFVFGIILVISPLFIWKWAKATCSEVAELKKEVVVLNCMLERLELMARSIAPETAEAVDAYQAELTQRQHTKR